MLIASVQGKAHGNAVMRGVSNCAGQGQIFISEASRISKAYGFREYETASAGYTARREKSLEVKHQVGLSYAFETQYQMESPSSNKLKPRA